MIQDIYIPEERLRGFEQISQKQWMMILITS